MMARLVRPAALGRLSGFAWAAGYAGGLLSLVLVLGFLAADPASGRTLFGLPPLFGLDPATREGDRAAGPVAALWCLLLVWPLLLWTPDAPASGLPLRRAVADGIGRLRRTWADARAAPRVAGFLVANMLYQDGLVALFAFGGIYGAGVLGWGTTELGLFGIALTIAGTLGAVAGGIAEDRLGARPVILGSLGVLFSACLLILSIGRDHVLFVVRRRRPRRATACSAACRNAPSWASGCSSAPWRGRSRPPPGRSSPGSCPDGEAGRYFGLFALSGRLTSFAAPLAVATATALAGTQKAGPAVLLLFFGAGAWLFARSVRRS